MEIAAGNSRNILPDTPGIGVSAGDLEDFIANKADLKLGFKLGLVKILYPNGGVSFDPVTDRLISISPPPSSLGSPPAPWVNPDSAIAKAQAALKAALAAASPPATRRQSLLAPPAPGNQQPIQWPMQRPGF